MIITDRCGMFGCNRMSIGKFSIARGVGIPMCAICAINDGWAYCIELDCWWSLGDPEDIEFDN